MNVEDADIAWAERDASPTRLHSYDPQDQLEGEYDRIHTEREARSQSRRRSHASSDRNRQEAVEEVEEVEPVRTHRHGDGPHGPPNETGSRASSSVSSVSTLERERTRQRQMSTISKSSTRMERALMEYLDRHPTAIERIEAHRLQHMQTVGSRKVFTGTGVELPDFGGMYIDRLLSAFSLHSVAHTSVHQILPF
jgi:DHA1 family multidrug resistance protein-like MFS transporter